MKESNCDDSLHEAIACFRLGMDSQGSAALVKFIDCLAPSLEANAGTLTAEDTGLLSGLFEAQSRQDYLYVADLLEYVLPKSGLADCLKSAQP